MTTTVDNLCDVLVRSRLFSAADVQTLHQGWHCEAGASAADGVGFGKWLVDHQYVTAYQLDRLQRGQTNHYFFNQYKLLDRIGQGRMAGVYKAAHRLGPVVAIKVLPPSKAKDPVAFGRFQREARLALRLKHPNVVRTFQTGAAEGLHYLVMEFLDGETLEETLQRRKKLPPAEAVRLVEQALQGLQHLHEQGMVHRDLKPANLMLVAAPGPGSHDTTLSSTLKILDIGVGRALFDEGEPGGGNQQDLTNRGDLLGSPDTMAPEQARDAHSADVRADIYSLGCILYHALTGQPPFPGDNVVQKIVRHATEKPRPVKEFTPGVPTELQQILDTMLAKDPALRYPTPAKAARALQSVMERKPPAAHAPAAADPAARQMQAYENWLESEDPEAGGRQSPAAPDGAPGQSFWKRHQPKLLAGAGVVAFGLLAWVGYLLFAPDREKPKTQHHQGQEEKPAPWEKRVAALKPKAQVAAVLARLKKRNPGFDERGARHKIQDGVVTELQFVTDAVTDLTPVRALKGLKRLSCPGSNPGKGKLADLRALRGLELAVLDVSSTKVSSLAPLWGMPLVYLGIAGTQVRDLSPVADMPLMVLHCAGAPVKDLSPLEGLELTLLDAGGCPVDDLAPLRGMPLTALWCPVKPRRDSEVLRSLRMLKTINGKPAAETWKELVDEQKSLDQWVRKSSVQPAHVLVGLVEKKLRQRNPGFKGWPKPPVIRNGAVVEVHLTGNVITDLSPLRAFPRLEKLDCHGSGAGKGRLASLQPLRGLRLTALDCAETRVSDLAPLRDMPLTTLNLHGCARVRDLGPLRKLPLVSLNIAGTGVSDLAPLRGRPLHYLFAEGTRVRDLSPLRGLALQGLTVDLIPARDNEVLRSLKQLAQINYQSAAKYWENMDREEAWVRRVSGLSGEKQIKEVTRALKDRNRAFAGKPVWVTLRGVVLGLTLSGDQVTDLTPLRALPHLTQLTCAGSAPGKGRLTDLWPLKGLGLRSLDIRHNPVTDLSPLRSLPLRKLKCDFQAGRDRAVLEPMQTLRTINGQPVSKIWAKAPIPIRGKPVLAARFLGELVSVNASDRKLRVKLTQSIVLQNSWHAARFLHHQLKLRDALLIKNPVQRLRAAQEQLVWIAYHRAHLYYRQEKHHYLDLQLVAGVEVRTFLRPLKYDSKGNVRKPTPAEIAAMKGPGKHKSYLARFDNLRPGQVVMVYLARVDVSPLPGKKSASRPPERPFQVSKIVIYRETI
jgi:Leucine-rich repeat (LRR) protein